MTEQTLEQAQLINEETLSFEDYLAHYDGQATEWHAGKVVEKVTNNTQHNRIQFFLSQLFSFYMNFKSLGEVLIAGIPMFISKDQAAREPDIIILLNESLPRLKSKFLEGAADLVVEIVSPSSVQIDRGAKFEEYEAAGVREYWLIDPLREELLLYVLNEKKHYQRVDADAEGRFHSHVLQGFSIHAKILWQDPLPQAMEIVKLAQDLAN